MTHTSSHIIITLTINEETAEHLDQCIGKGAHKENHTREEVAAHFLNKCTPGHSNGGKPGHEDHHSV